MLAKTLNYRWKKEFGSMKIDQVEKLKDLEKENARLKKVVAGLVLEVHRSSCSYQVKPNEFYIWCWSDNINRQLNQIK